MDLPPLLVDAVMSGRAVLLLGAGSSIEAKTAAGLTGPSSGELSGLLADKFLEPRYKSMPLASVGQYAEDTAGLADVEIYLRDIFEPLLPTTYHKIIPTLVWKAIATTNYDRVVEKSYEAVPKHAQECFPVVSNADRITTEMQGRESVILYKVHGCVSRVPNASCPLILTHDQYLTHLQGRDKLFHNLNTLAYDHPFIFVGHSVTDPDLREIVLRTANATASRPQFYLIAPDVDNIQIGSWATKRVTAIKGTLESLLRKLDATVPKNRRNVLQSLLDLDIPIAKRFRISGAKPSPALNSFFDHDAFYVPSLDAAPILTATEFYKGYNPVWGAVAQDLDIKRELHETILSAVFLIDESERRRRPELFVIKGASGSGKSILLQRLALDVARDLDLLCVYLKDAASVSIDVLAEIAEKCKERIFLFVDNVGDQAGQLRYICDHLPQSVKLTIIAAERTSEWNMASRLLDDWTIQEFEIGLLSNREANDLVEKLSVHSCLSTLAGRPKEEIVEELRKRAYRQLLVALYEVTHGKPLEEIVVDEYRQLPSEEAKSIYLTLCVLNRFNIAVRAGVVSRIHDINFTEFRDRFFLPLEHIVYTSVDPGTDDHTYRTRHPVIADIVFREVLDDGEDRYDKYVECLNGLNPMFTLDRQVVRDLLRGRSLHSVFPNHEHVAGIYRTAGNLFAGDAFLLQQEAIYEMIRPNGNLKRALELLSKAEDLAPRDTSIKHSQAELQVAMADGAHSIIEQERHWVQAEKLAESLKSTSQDSFPYHTLTKIGIRRLKARIQSADITSTDILGLVKSVEENLTEGLQRFPGDPYLKDSESQLAAIDSNEARVRSALEESFAKNPRSSYVAKRLARILADSGEVSTAKEVLLKGLEANPSSAVLHFNYAVLMLDEEGSQDLVLHHLRRSYTQGDTNFEAQVLYGRQLLLAGRVDDAAEVFQVLSETRGARGRRDVRLWPLSTRWNGYLRRKEGGYGQVQWDKWNRWVFALRSDTTETWDSLNVGGLVSFSIAFNLLGPVAMDIRNA